MASTCSVLGIQQATIKDHRLAIGSFHRVSSSLEFDTRHTLTSNALKSLDQGRAQVGTEQKVRRRTAPSVLSGGATLTPLWGVGDGVLFLALGTSFLFLARATEMIAFSINTIHAGDGLRRGDVSFVKRAVQVSVGQQHLTGRVGLRFL